MNTRKKTIIALTLAVGVAASGAAIAQSMQHGGHGMSGGMQQERHGGIHANMHGMKGGLQGGMHGQGGMQGGMHDQGGMQGGMHGQGGSHGGSHGSGHGQGAASGDRSASSIAFAAVNEKMHGDMAIQFSGNPDADFARGMIPHHQGAVDMAKIVVAFGKDPEIRKLAENIVKSQETEIAFMREWLKKQGK